jgi:hypothetical protein
MEIIPDRVDCIELKLEDGQMEALALKAPIPVLRVFDEAKAREFYIDFLEFHLDWEHKYEESFPIFMQISKGVWVINLSEHHNDACPGSTLRMETGSIDAYRKLLNGKNYKYSRPDIEDTSYGVREMRLGDPFGNKLIFFERKAS